MHRLDFRFDETDRKPRFFVFWYSIVPLIFHSTHLFLEYLPSTLLLVVKEKRTSLELKREETPISWALGPELGL